MTSGLNERISILSSAKVSPSDDIQFKTPRLVGGYNWIDDDGDDEPVIAVPGESFPFEVRNSGG
jgi:inorganic pyrophosphatase